MGRFSYVIDNMIWSYSRLASYEMCPYNWMSHYIYDEPTVPRFFATNGGFMHYLLQEYFLNNLQSENILVTYYTDFRDFVQGEAPSAKVFKTYFNDCTRYLKNKKLLDYPGDYKIRGVEEHIDFLVEDYPFTGIVDLIIEDDTGLVEIDHKSRIIRPPSERKKPTAYDVEREERLKQLYLYSEAIKARFYSYPHKLIFNCFRVPKLVTEDFDPKKLQNTKRWAVDTIHEIRDAEVFPPRPEYFKCRFICDLADCPYRDLT